MKTSIEHLIGDDIVSSDNLFLRLWRKTDFIGHLIWDDGPYLSNEIISEELISLLLSIVVGDDFLKEVHAILAKK